MFSFLGDLNALLNYETAAQRHNVPIMLGVDAIQKIYGSSNNFVPPAITTLIRNVGLSFCQSASIIKVCIFKRDYTLSNERTCEYCKFRASSHEFLSSKLILL